MARVNSWTLVMMGLALATPLRAQDPMPNPQEMQMRIQHILQERPREAEAAARAFLQLIAPNLISTLDSLKGGATGTPGQPVFMIDGVPQNLSDRGGDQYWAEVAQLTVQFGMVQNLTQRDSSRAHLVARMFGLEANARAQQRAYRGAAETSRPGIRGKIEALITQHFDVEDQLRALEVADIERRLADVRAESQRRRDKRAELIKWAVDDAWKNADEPMPTLEEL
jgi:hypothetical protein